MRLFLYISQIRAVAGWSAIAFGLFFAIFVEPHSVFIVTGILLTSIGAFYLTRYADSIWDAQAIFLGRTKTPKLVGWEQLPPLSVCVFGNSADVNGIENIKNAFIEYLQYYYPSKKPKPEDYRFWNNLLEKKLRIVDVPDRSSIGRIDKHSRLNEVLGHVLYGVLLLIDQDASISINNSRMILRVLSAFRCNSKLMVLQGLGKHAFIRQEALVRFSLPYSGKIGACCKRFGMKWSRVDYISIGSTGIQDYTW